MWSYTGKRKYRIHHVYTRNIADFNRLSEAVAALSKAVQPKDNYITRVKNGRTAAYFLANGKPDRRPA